MPFYAHTTGGPKETWQLLPEHLEEAAMLAGARAAAFGFGNAGHLTGLLHDLGKYTDAFQRRLEGGERVDHATAGAREVLALGHARFDGFVAQLIAYAIAGHHAGLPDATGSDTSLAERLKRPAEPLHPAWREELALPTGSLFSDSFKLLADKAQASFQLAMLGRMLFSCLIDADRRNTAAFAESHGEPKEDREWPALSDRLADWTMRLDARLAQFSSTGEVNRWRAEILAHVRAGASKAPGLFTLTVPTGGGKTLASLAFALDHARAHGHRRIVYAIPFTSIIDQTAAVFRGILGEDDILEHHSALEGEKLSQHKGEPDAAKKMRLAMQDWVAPLVVTTNVQLFESLFSHRPSRCRKLHNLAGSIIVLDEAQTIPLHVLRPAVAALDELARNYGCTIVLCTATQPALGLPAFEGGLDLPPERELAPEPKKLQTAFRRVTLSRIGPLDDGALVEALGESSQGLAIVNSRGHARVLFSRAKEAGLDGLVHLTTRQYAAHRRAILADVRARLQAGEPCRVVATSLVEAGVDLDFPRVWRAEAGLDSIHQAAGRCNREGRRSVEDSVVTVFSAPDHPAPRELRQFADATAALRQSDLLSLEAMRDYFEEIYWRRGKEGLDRTVIPRDAFGRTEIQVLDCFGIGAGKLSLGYRTVGENFRLISQGMVPVIVARDEVEREARACDALNLLRQDRISAGDVARRLQSFVVQVPPKARARLLAAGHVALFEQDRFGDQFCRLVTGSRYGDATGLDWDDAEYLASESLLF